jgi:hypothetical protein
MLRLGLLARTERLPFLFLIGIAIASAHEIATHQNIGNSAITYLQQIQPNRPLLTGIYRLYIGAAHEDDFFPGSSIMGRFMFHFYSASPTETNPFYFTRTIYPPPQIPPVVVSGGANCTSRAWGVDSPTSTPSKPTGITGCTATLTYSLPSLGLSNVSFPLSPITVSNDFSWDNVLTPDSTGAPAQDSITGFGYVVHLLEDLGSPPHVRNDAHACPPEVLSGLLTPSVLRTPTFDALCDPFERYNDAAESTTAGNPSLTTGWSNFLLNGSPIISTSEFSTPQQFFDSLQNYVSTNYYSANTIFDGKYYSNSPLPGVPPGPVPIADIPDPTYFWAACIPASNLAETCFPVQTSQGSTVMARKIAHKGYLYWALCSTVGICTDSISHPTIDHVIANEQFAELGPVIAQHVAAFIRFYAPALTVESQGNGAGTVGGFSTVLLPDGSFSNPAPWICGLPCSKLLVQGTQVTLSATASSGSTFAGWGGECASAGTSTYATVTIASDMVCTAAFTSAGISGTTWTGMETLNPVVFPNFTPNSFPVTFNFSGSSGSLSASITALGGTYSEVGQQVGNVITLTNPTDCVGTPPLPVCEIETTLTVSGNTMSGVEAYVPPYGTPSGVTTRSFTLNRVIQ